MNGLDLSWIEEARVCEVEAVDGGRSLPELTLDPGTSGSVEEAAILGRSVDDIEEIGERRRLVPRFADYAMRAYRQRGLVYPFQPAPSGDSFTIVPGLETQARRAAELSRMIRQGHEIAKGFEAAGFQALQALVGGWGICVGAPRRNRLGPEKAIRRFRGELEEWERGDELPSDFARNGDHGADGFLVLGRGWGGPIMFYQAKNSNFRLRDHPEEFGRISEICNDWFGTRHDCHRRIIPVFATNSVLTLEMKVEEARSRSRRCGVG
jgi:hypothetical protein